MGIATSNDVFYKIVNPLLGITQTGKHIIVHEAGDVEEIRKVLECIRGAGLKIESLWRPSGPGKNDLIIHLEARDVSGFVSRLKQMGFSVEEREFTSW